MRRILEDIHASVKPFAFFWVHTTFSGALRWAYKPLPINPPQMGRTHFLHSLHGA